MITDLLHDSHFWVALSFLGFCALVYTKGRKPILGILDARSLKIKSDLDEAARLRAQAEALLSEGQRQHRDALQTAQKILDGARESADRMHLATEKKLADSLQRREEQLFARIARAEAAAVQDIRTQAADLAARAAEQILQDNMPKSGGRLIDDAIRELPARLS